MFGCCLVNHSVKASTLELQKHANLTERQLQFVTTSSSYILGIFLSFFGSFIVHKVGVSKSILLWTLGSFIGWILFSLAVDIKIFGLMVLGRIIQGGSMAALRVAFNVFCVSWFHVKHFFFYFFIIWVTVSQSFFNAKYFHFWLTKLTPFFWLRFLTRRMFSFVSLLCFPFVLRRGIASLLGKERAREGGGTLEAGRN